MFEQLRDQRSTDDVISSQLAMRRAGHNDGAYCLQDRRRWGERWYPRSVDEEGGLPPSSSWLSEDWLVRRGGSLVSGLLALIGAAYG
jgi:hypothetical protein